MSYVHFSSTLGTLAVPRRFASAVYGLLFFAPVPLLDASEARLAAQLPGAFWVKG